MLHLRENTIDEDEKHPKPIEVCGGNPTSNKFFPTLLSSLRKIKGP
jgi:hypothetical protein